MCFPVQIDINDLSLNLQKQTRHIFYERTPIYRTQIMSFLTNISADSGILRKNDHKDKLEDLLVFGYACKLFRDDQKALEIDQGKHLIPWMADNTLKIDRYDGRGALSDLIPYEASREGYDATRWLGLSESERKIEQLCDEERYYSLYTNEDEAELYKEEELKRTQTNQIQYNYNEENSRNNKPDGSDLAKEEDDEPFVPPPDLDVPVGMVLPKTVKQNIRIEKTASFINKEGLQMEILLKTKQSGNPQFGFLNQDDELYRYYRHILMAIKTGRYKMRPEPQKSEPEESKEESYYLHPSLAPEVNMNPVPQISYKPSADCAYSQLIQRIQGVHPNAEIVSTSVPDASNMNIYNHPLYLQYYQQYGCYPNFDQAQYYAQYGAYQDYQPNNTNPYAQIVSNLKPKEDLTTPDMEISKAPIIYGEKPEKVKKPLFSLAEYSDSENEEEEPQESSAQAIVVPPVDVQVIIDKMAAYVAKNGADFEVIVKSKGDQRFIFLESSHPFHPYYKYKVKEFVEKNSGKKIEQKEDKKENESKAKKEEVSVKKNEEKEPKSSTKSKEKKVITPVSFSIKKPQTQSDQVARDKSALPVEDSTDDEEQLKNDGETNGGETNNQSETSKDEKNEKETNKEDNKNIIEIEDPIMELIDLTDELEEKRDKRAEDRLKDKIVAAAREKLAEKNRALQLERKKRAAAFLSQLKPHNSSNSNNIEEIKTVTRSTPEPGEIISTESYPADISRLVYHIERDASPKVEGEKNVRSRSNSRHRHKSSHRRKSHKRSHSHSRKRKRERRSRDRKKSKRRYSRSRSRSKSPYKHRNERKEELSDIEMKKPKKSREKSQDHSSYSSDYDSEVK